jgi:integrase
LGYRSTQLRARQPAAARRPAAPPVSPHLVDPAQGTLFEARRDWSCITIGSLDRLPSLTPSAQILLDAFGQHARNRAWASEVRRQAARSLRIVLAWVGADAPIPEADIRALSAVRPGTTARRVVQFLAQVDLLIPDPARRIDPDEAAIEQRIQSLPAGMHDELERWIQVLRGEGRRQHPVRSFETIRKYLGYVYPALEAWGQHVTSLREVTPQDVGQAIGERKGNTARSMHTGLGSLFRALKQERLVFRDPTRGISLPKIEHLPCPIPTDSLRGLIDRAPSPIAKLVVALVAIHGLGKYELTRLLLADLDLSRGHLIVRRDTGRHTVYLDELTHTLAIAWLLERHRRWPVTANPHLLVSQQTAADDMVPPVSGLVIALIFEPLCLSPSKLRQDRILEEARHTADPVHLMTVFGIAANTAMRYVYAAHPERRSVPPR